MKKKVNLTKNLKFSKVFLKNHSPCACGLSSKTRKFKSFSCKIHYVHVLWNKHEVKNIDNEWMGLKGRQRRKRLVLMFLFQLHYKAIMCEVTSQFYPQRPKIVHHWNFCSPHKNRISSETRMKIAILYQN